MKLTITEGKCGYCLQKIKSSGFANHITACRKSPYKVGFKSRNGDKIFLIGIRSEIPSYWMFVEVKGSASLNTLDDFLRKTWLECCGHMSHFIIGNTCYERYPMEDDFDEVERRTMKISMDEILSPKLIFNHEYDYGTTTITSLKVFAERRGGVQKPVTIVVRNEPPEWKCAFCKNPATKVCGICGLGFKAVMCKECLSKHECTKERGIALPLVNSPRTGQCGYTG